ncbi:4a-hydroxytetrahydrobiopterin dehydratase [bacterium]|nr:4a-hydroxytetrahydrobiopterin dehydratase [bacterium]
MATDLPKLTEAEIAERIPKLDGWRREGEQIVKDFVLRNFTDAAQFITRIAPLADGMDHHPDVQLYKFKRVRVELWTHSRGGLTQNDFDLATKIDGLGAS